MIRYIDMTIILAAVIGLAAFTGAAFHVAQGHLVDDALARTIFGAAAIVYTATIYRTTRP